MRLVSFSVQCPEEKPVEGNGCPEHIESSAPTVGQGWRPRPFLRMLCWLGKSEILCHSQTVWALSNQASVQSNSSNV